VKVWAVATSQLLRQSVATSKYFLKIIFLDCVLALVFVLLVA
jgi:hypothetical protein